MSLFSNDFENMGGPPIYGNDFKISQKYLEEIKMDKEEFFALLYNYFSRHIQLLVIGYDTQYLDEKNTEGPHYHFRFTSTQTKDTVSARKGKFVKEVIQRVGLPGFTYTHQKEAALFKLVDIVIYLAYAVKETKILYNDKIEADLPLKSAIDSAAKIALEKKEKDANYQKTKNDKKDEKDSQSDQALKFLISHTQSIYLGNQSNAMIQIYAILVKFQREQKILLYNTQMTAIAFRYLQEHTCMDDEQVAILRFARVV